MKSYLSGLSGRERSILISGALILFLSLLYAYGFHPLQKERLRLKSSISESREDAAWMIKAKEEAVRLKSGLPADLDFNRSVSGDPSKIVATQATIAGIKNATVTRVGVSSVKLSITEVRLDQFLRLAKELQLKYIIKVERCVISAVEAEGMVSIDSTLTLTQ